MTKQVISSGVNFYAKLEGVSPALFVRVMSLVVRKQISVKEQKEI